MRFTLATLLLLFFALAPHAHAAVLTLTPDTTRAGIGQEVSITLAVDTEETAVNATQATITFPVDILEVKAVNFTDSLFNFWVEEPTVSNEDGTITFIGGTATGKTGENLAILEIIFKTLGSGSASIVAKDAVVTASDGKGTNVLSSIEGATINVGVDVVVPESVFDPDAVVVSAPEEVTRTAVAATGLPAAPVLSVPLYPDPESWYRHREPVTVLWEVPPDVSRVAISVDDLPNSVPQKAEEKLFTGKALGVFNEGVTYIHVQFKNNIGWGDVAHYPVSIDTEPPLPFSIEFDGPIGDNPTPTFFLDTADARSGIGKILVSIDNVASYEFASTTITLPPQKPGIHTMLVKVLDKARNSADGMTTFEIDPLPTPTISFVTRSVSQDERGFVSGSAIPGGFVDIVVKNKLDEQVISGVSATDAVGRWEFVFEELLPTGRYTVSVAARDQRGAVSFPTEPERITIRPKTVISLGFIDLGWFELLALTVLLVLGLGSFLAWQFVEQKKTRSAYSTIARRDVEKLADLLSSELSQIESWYAKEEHLNKSVQTELEHRFSKLHENIAKMKKYVGREIGKAK